MKLIPAWLRRAAEPTEAKASAAGPSIAMVHMGQPVWTPRDYENQAREAYTINPVAYRCVKLIAANAASIPLCLYNGKDEIEEHPLLALLARPNPMMNGTALQEAAFSFLMLAGNTYVEAVGPERRPPRELWNLRPDRMRVIPGASGVPAGYEHEVHGRKIRWDADQLTGQGPILHVKEFHPLNDWYGQSRVEAAAWGIDRHNGAASHNKALLDNGARPSGALVFKPVQTADGPQSAPQHVLDAADRRLQEHHAGALNAGKPMVIGGEVVWEQMGLSPVDMDFAVGKDDSAWDICIAMGVPPILIVKGSQTYNNISEAKLELFEETVLPIVDLMVDGLNKWLTPFFGDRLTLKPDLDRISALEKRREIRRKTAIDLMDKGVIDSSEAREMLDYGPRAPEAVQKVDASVISALLGAVDKIGLTPLFRYMRSVGLVEPGMDEAAMLEAAMNAMEDGQPDTADQTDNQDPPQDGIAEDGTQDAEV